MSQQHPITPPLELVGQWRTQAADLQLLTPYDLNYLATQAARWGDDQRLEACAEWVANNISTPEAAELRAAMRASPPSLREQALEQLRILDQYGALDCNTDKIRRALEALDD